MENEWSKCLVFRQKLKKSCGHKAMVFSQTKNIILTSKKLSWIGKYMIDMILYVRIWTTILFWINADMITVVVIYNNENNNSRKMFPNFQETKAERIRRSFPQSRIFGIYRKFLRTLSTIRSSWAIDILNYRVHVHRYLKQRIIMVIGK